MPVQNAEVAEVFERYADLLEIEGANPFRVRAYRSAAGSVRAMPRRLADREADYAALLEQIQRIDSGRHFFNPAPLALA